MTLAERVAKIEISLTPKQAVLLWLTEAQQVAGFRDWIAKNAETLCDAHPRAVIATKVANAVWDALCRKGVSLEAIKRAQLQARKQTDFLVTLALNVNQGRLAESEKDYLIMLSVSGQRLSMMERVVEHVSIDSEEWDAWRTMLIATLERLWGQQAAIAAISTEYYDDHQVLFANEAAELNNCIEVVKCSVRVYNTGKGVVPSWKAIDLAALRRSIEPQVRAAVRELVDRAKAEMLLAFGEVEAARRIAQAHLVAYADRQSSARVPHPPG